MYQCTFDSKRFGRAGLALIALGVSAFSLAGETIKVGSAGVRQSSRPVVTDTRTFFPQINPTLSQRTITPKNPSLQRAWRDKAPTGFVGGGIGGDTTGNLGAKFPGIGFTGYIPADPQIAVSKTHIVQVTNVDIAFFNKSGTKQFQSNMGPSGFFSGIGAGSFTFDPKVFFDKTSNRFFVVILDADFNAKTSNFLIAMSDDADPNGKWTKWKVNNEGTQNNTEAWLDYEGWGFNKDGIAASGNMFTYGGGYAGYVMAFLFKKSEMLAGQTLNVSSWFDDQTFTIQCAKMDDKTVPYIYATSLDDTSNNSAVRVYAFRNITAGTPELVYTSVTVPDFNFIGRPPSAGGAFLDSLSGRLVDATFRTGSLLTCHTTRANSGTTRGQVTWYDIKPNAWPASGSPTLFQAGDVALPGDAWAIIPGIHKNSAGDITVIFTRCSPSIIADVMGAARKSTDPKGQMGTPFLLATSASTYRMSGRWGDYISACVDPVDELTFWGNAMNSTATGSWGTAIVSWKVSTGGGGGNNGIKPDGVSTFEGTFSAGNLAGIQTSNGATYDTNTVKKPDGSYATAVQTTYTITQAKNSVLGLDVLVKGYVAPGRTPVGYVFLWNTNTSKWDYVAAFNLSGTNKNYRVGVSTGGSAYVSTAKKVKVLVRALDPVRRNGYSPAPFKLKGDSVQIEVTTR